MRAIRHKKQKSFFKETLALIAIVTVIPTAIIAFCGYLIITSKIKQDVEANQQQKNQQINDIVNQELDLLEQTVLKWSYSSIFSKMLGVENFSQQYELVNEMYDTLTLIKNSNKVIGDVRFYIEGKGIYSSEIQINRLKAEEEESLQKYLNGIKGNYSYTSGGSILDILNMGNKLKTTLVCRIHSLSGMSDRGYLFVTINQRYLDVFLNKLNSDPGCFAYIIEPDGEIYMPDTQNSGYNLEFANYLKEHLDGDSITIQDFNKQEYAISQVRYKKNGWIVVTASSLTQLLSPVRDMSRLLIFMNTVVMVFATFMILFASKRIYSPVRNLVRIFGGTDTDIKQTGKALDTAAIGQELKKNEFVFILDRLDKIDKDRHKLKSLVDEKQYVMENSFLIPLADIPSKYPLSHEEKIIKCIKDGMPDEAREVLDGFVHELAVMSLDLALQKDNEYQSAECNTKIRTVQFGVIHLLGNILHAVIQSGSRASIMLNSYQNIYFELCSFRKIDEMKDWFFDKVVAPCATDFKEINSKRDNCIVNKVIEYIDVNYTRDISLDDCAQSLGITGKNLSFIFSKVTGVNFKEYITHMKIEKAKELMVKTEESINHIAASVGYNAQYFAKVFKSREDMTPGEYRLNHRVQ